MKRGRAGRPMEERFWERVTHPRTGSCWLWTGAVSRGYGVLEVLQKHGGSRRWVIAHRYAYELLVGPIPVGFVIVHRCPNQLCMNPAHLEPATVRESVLRGRGVTAQQARQTHCKRGHPLTEENIWRYGNRRMCKACQRLSKEARKGALSAA